MGISTSWDIKNMPFHLLPEQSLPYYNSLNTVLKHFSHIWFKIGENIWDSLSLIWIATQLSAQNFITFHLQILMLNLGYLIKQEI